MATGATGTASTNLLIPKINPSVDIPDGSGINSIVDYFDGTSFTGYARKPAGIVSGEAAVWNGSAWVRSSVTPLGTTSIGTGTPAASKYVDGASGVWTALPVATVNFATTLPTATDGTETVLTDSVSAPTYMWRLRYVSAATKWYPQAGSWGYGTALSAPPALVDRLLLRAPRAR